MDLGKMSLVELRRLQSKVEAEIRRRSESARRDLLKKMQKMAAEEGLSLDDLLDKKAPTEKKSTRKHATRKTAVKKTGGLPAKYRHPENAAIGWSGRGRKPQWVLDWVAQGKSLTELAV